MPGFYLYSAGGSDRAFVPMVRTKGRTDRFISFAILENEESGVFMQLQDLLITEQATVKDAIQQLERLRCKVIYVVKDRKLLASVSDGDVRRYTLQAGNINDSVSQIANYTPCTCSEYEEEAWQTIFQNTGMYSIPIVNLNGEIIGVVYQNGTCRAVLFPESVHIPYPRHVLPRSRSPRSLPRLHSYSLYPRINLIDCVHHFVDVHLGAVH